MELFSTENANIGKRFKCATDLKTAGAQNVCGNREKGAPDSKLIIFKENNFLIVL